MGIRVNRFLGYGLTDVQHEKYEITDDRINTSSWLLDFEPPPNGAYLTWLSQRPEASGYSIDRWYLRDTPEQKQRDLCSCIAYSPEYGLPNVLALQPLAMTNWARHDDSIDYVQETWLRPQRKRQLNHVEEIPGCLYPWEGAYMDAQTGERLPQDILEWVRLRNDRPFPRREEGLEVLAQHFGFADHAEATARVVPVIPEEVRDLLEFSQLFSDDKAWRQLRPLLYTYWS